MADFERVILVVDNALDWELYAAVLPLYFPRTEEEAKAVRFVALIIGWRTRAHFVLPGGARFAGRLRQRMGRDCD